MVGREEPEQVDQIFRDLTRSKLQAANVWADAYLAAVAKASGLAIASLDRIFARMPGIEAMIL